MENDGTSEVIPQHIDFRNEGRLIAPQLSTTIFKFDGSIAATLPGINSQRSRFVCRDYDGDWIADLLLLDNRAGGIFHLHRSGKESLDFAAPFDPLVYFFADVDSDGRCSIVMRKDAQSPSYYSYRHTGELRELNVPPYAGPKLLHEYATHADLSMGAADLNDDGIDELLFVAGYYDLAASQYINFSYPPKTHGHGGFGREMACGDFLRDGRCLVAVSIGQYRFSQTGVCLFDTAGQCVYYREFGQDVFGLETLHTDQGDHLTVLCSDRLLIYP